MVRLSPLQRTIISGIRLRRGEDLPMHHQINGKTYQN
jgi:hypothetical protein